MRTVDDAEVRPLAIFDPQNDEHQGALSQVDTVGFDLETDAFHAYQERVCLLQLSTHSGEWLVDPLVETGRLPMAVQKLLTRPETTLVAHAVDNDVRALKRDFGFAPVTVFDTALAARVLGRDRPLGLQKLLEATLSVRIEKDEQRSDWKKRPLSEEQLRYAQQDVRWLIPLKDALQKELKSAERVAWHEEECARALKVEPKPKTFDAEAWRKVKGAKDLGSRGRAVMASLWRWREAQAEAENRSPFRVMYPEQLAKMARVADAHGQKSLSKIEKFRSLKSSVALDDLVAAVQRGLSEPDPGAKKPPAAPRKDPLSVGQQEKLSRLKEGRAAWADRLGLESGFLLSNQTLDRMARAEVRALDELRALEELDGWRLSVLGTEIGDALGL